MREIKFRAWSERVGMYEIDVLAINPVTWDCGSKKGVSLAYQPHIKVMQYTGLKDKNGVEIYDGDILYYSLFDHNDNDIQYKGIVRWFGTGFVVTREPDDKGEGKYGLELFWIYNQDSELKVIGNIHFNPELIK
jgi:uncharacterized phage protein (TIGR01671 family)